MAVEQRIARVNSGDVSLFYRVFGSPGKTPLVPSLGQTYELSFLIRNTYGCVQLLRG